jgi:hypothetical protein
MSDSTSIEQLLEELRSLREENAILRDEIHEHGVRADAVSAAIDTVHQMSVLIERMLDAFAVLLRRHQEHPIDEPEPALDDPEPEPPPRQVGKLAHQEWATYEGMRAHLIGLEEEWNDEQKELGLRRTVVTREVIAGKAGVHPRTVARHMAEDWHLDPRRDWPPSRWPEHQPPGTGHIQGHLVGFAAAGFWVTLDLLDDNKVDHAVRFCQQVLHLVTAHF